MKKLEVAGPSLIDMSKSMFTLAYVYQEIQAVQCRVVAGTTTSCYSVWYIRPKKGEWDLPIR